MKAHIWTCCPDSACQWCNVALTHARVFSSQGYAHCVDVYIKQCQEVRIKNWFSLQNTYCCCCWPGIFFRLGCHFFLNCLFREPTWGTMCSRTLRFSVKGSTNRWARCLAAQRRLWPSSFRTSLKTNCRWDTLLAGNCTFHWRIDYLSCLIWCLWFPRPMLRISWMEPGIQM